VILVVETARPHPSVEAPHAELDQLRVELAQLQQAMSRRAPIEQAKGALMERMRCSAEEAFAELVRRSQRSHIKLHDVAVALLADIPARTSHNDRERHVDE
jgi:AmiR/NasT family two-component response regulator